MNVQSAENFHLSILASDCVVVSDEMIKPVGCGGSTLLLCRIPISCLVIGSHCI